MKNIISYITCALLIVYGFYSIAPLSYDAVSGRPDSLNSLSGGVPKIIKLFAVDTILSALFSEYQTESAPSEDPNGDASSHDHILLLKKRALRISITQLIAQLSSQSLTRLGGPSRDEAVSHTLPAVVACSTCPHGYHAQHSGASPPFA